MLIELFSRPLQVEVIPKELRKSALGPVFKGNGDIKECGNYQGIKLISHTMNYGMDELNDETLLGWICF